MVRSVIVLASLVTLAGRSQAEEPTAGAAHPESKSDSAATSIQPRSTRAFVGTWEASVNYPMRLFLLQLDQATHRSRLAMASSEVFLFNVNRIETKGNRVTVVCTGRDIAWNLAIRMVVDDWSGDGEGSWKAKIVLTDATRKVVYNKWNVLLMGCKGGCVEKFQEMKEAARTALTTEDAGVTTPSGADAGGLGAKDPKARGE